MGESWRNLSNFCVPELETQEPIIEWHCSHLVVSIPTFEIKTISEYIQQFPYYSLLQTLALPPCSLSLSIWIAILYILYSACPCPQSNCQRMSSYSRQSSTSSNVSTAGTSSFQVGRERQRQPEMELFRWVEIYSKT